MSTYTARAKAHSNIALIKYWGKRHTGLKLPHNNSISLTLDKMYTETQIHFDPKLSQDSLILDGHLALPKATQRVAEFLDLVRTLYKVDLFAQVSSQNSFPTAAGLASSASGFAALAHATNLALGLKLSPRELSILARQGSGSASRSIFGGFSEWHKGEQEDGLDSFASPIENQKPWPLCMVVLLLNKEHKQISSSVGMKRTVDTSPLYEGWLASIPADLIEMRLAIQNQDFDVLGPLMEHNALKMHATALAARPSAIYWQAQTLALLHWLQALRPKVQAYATIDAGPNLKILLQEEGLAEFILQLKTDHPHLEYIVNRSGPAVSGETL